jgi:hypothetical protein
MSSSSSQRQQRQQPKKKRLIDVLSETIISIIEQVFLNESVKAKIEKQEKKEELLKLKNQIKDLLDVNVFANAKEKETKIEFVGFLMWIINKFYVEKNLEKVDLKDFIKSVQETVCKFEFDGKKPFSKINLLPDEFYDSLHQKLRVVHEISKKCEEKNPLIDVSWQEVFLRMVNKMGLNASNLISYIQRSNIKSL